jgi:F0F1-type ATP synthase membrane subunit a
MIKVEQFEILPIFFIFFCFSITNQVLILGLIVLFFSVVFFIVSKETTKKLFLIPNRFQFSTEIIFSLMFNMVIDIIIEKGIKKTVFSKRLAYRIFISFTTVSSLYFISLLLKDVFTW